MQGRPYGNFKKAFIFARWISSAQSIDMLDSPFLFEFYNEVIRFRPEKKILKELEDFRNQWLSDHRMIPTQDYGAGSIGGNASYKKISSIAATALSSPHKCNLLYNIGRYFQFDNGLELGTSLGIATLYLRLSSQHAKLTTIEGDPTIASLAAEHLNLFDVNLKVGPFHHIVPNLPCDHPFDLIYLDGGHHSQKVWDTLQLLKRLTNHATVYIIDDIYWSSDMTSLWHELKSSSDYNVTLDLWYFGILFNHPKLKEPIDQKITPLDIRWKMGLFR